MARFAWVLLVGCGGRPEVLVDAPRAGGPVTSGDAGDTGDPSDSGDTAEPGFCEGAELPDWPSCPGRVVAWSVPDGDAARRALGMVQHDAGASLVRRVQADARDGCPVQIELPGGRVRYAGPCTTAGGVEYTGAVEVDADGFGWTFDDMAAVAASWSWRVSGKGEAVSAGDVYYSDAALAWSVEDDGTLGLPSGVGWTQGRYVWSNANVSVALRLRVADSVAGAGDFCVAEVLSPWACGDELDGYQRVVGDRAWQVVWDGGSDCDGCGCEDLDGAALGRPCDYEQPTLLAGSGVDPCDGLDSDGDGRVDEGTALPWFADADGDGHGAGPVTLACAAPLGTVADAGDCDDADPHAWPDALERCGDGADQDCDGEDVACAVPSALAPGDADGVYLGAFEGSRAGGALAAADVDGDGDAELLVRSEDQGAAAYLVHGSPAGVADLAVAAVASFVFPTSAGDEALAFLRGPDGVSVVVSEPVYEQAIYLWSGPVLGERRPEDASATFTAPDAVRSAGASLVAVDLDADGADELLIGAHDEELVAGAFVVSGSASGATSLDARPSLWGDTTWTSVVAVAAPGDVDGDGLPEVLLGATGSARLADKGGAVHVVSGPWTGVGDVTTAPAVLGSTEREALGSAMAGGDVDGDGYSDLLLGAPAAESSTGAAWLVPGGPRLATGAEVDLAVASLVGTDAVGLVGDALSVRDGDGDGLAEVLVGAPADGGALLGWRGPIRGVLDATAPDVAFASPRGGVGASFVEVDGTWVIGAPTDPTAAENAGAVWFLDAPW